MTPLEIIITVGIPLVVAFVFYILGINANNPKLIISGGGGGSTNVNGDMVRNVRLTIYNDPRFFGMKLDRKAAHITRVYLKDKKKNLNYPLSNNWIVQNSTDLSKDAIIENGDNRSLYLFLKKDSSDKYCIYRTDAFEIPANATNFSDEKKEFSLYLEDKPGRKYRFDILVLKSGQNIHVRQAITFHERFRNVREAFSLLRDALKPGKFR